MRAPAGETPPLGNPLKDALRDGRLQLGLFCNVPAIQTVEVLAPAGLDFVILDTEHSPTTLPVLHSQLAALSGTTTTAVVRLTSHDPVQIKHCLDLGLIGLMAPNVRSAEDARYLVRQTRYPPEGERGIGGGVRATGYGRDRSYYRRANGQLCLIVQIESAEGLAQLDAIAEVDGVDCVFFGPHDLAASCGHLGEPSHPEIVRLIEDGIAKVCRKGKAAGVVAAGADRARYLQAGVRLLAIGSEIGLLAQAVDSAVAAARAAV
jgi:2-keto-3-deoxy-L-rhamnonate aldolase RhmA